jgi:hypothetical protein
MIGEVAKTVLLLSDQRDFDCDNYPWRKDGYENTGSHRDVGYAVKE